MSLMGTTATAGFWYCEHGTVAQVAEALHLSRPRVAHAVRPQARNVAARRLVVLA
jgi:hypothetical protein